MKSSAISRLIALLFSILTLSVNATTVEQLIDDEQLQVKVHLVTKEPLVVKQPIVISVELLTQRWFGSGNRIHDFDMPQMIKLPMDGLAINGTTRINGKQWTSQIREITVYPMEAGTYELPSLLVDVAVNTTEGLVKGTVNTDAISLNVSLPNELRAVTDFVVTNNFNVQTSGAFEQDKEYKIGEAVTLEYKLTAEGVPAMMLPEIPTFNIEGIGIYRKKPSLLNKSNRGELTGYREEEINFIFEKQGSYQIPEIRLYWWNIDSQSVEEVVLPAQSWVVSDEVLVSEQETSANLWSQIKGLAWQRILALLVILLGGYQLVKYIVRNRSFWISVYKQITHYDRRHFTQQYLTAVRKKDYRLACQKLYQLMPYYVRQNPHEQYEFSANTLADCYGKTEPQKAAIKHLLDLAFNNKPGTFELTEAKILLHGIKSEKQTQRLFEEHRKISLNKGDGS